VTHDPQMRVLVAGDTTDPRAEWRLVVHDGRVAFRRSERGDVPHASRRGGAGTDPASFEGQLSHRLQAYAFDAIVAANNCPDELRAAAARAGVPFAEIAPDEDIHRCAERAIASARTFGDGPR
jgi:hypothetical protein